MAEPVYCGSDKKFLLGWGQGRDSHLDANLGGRNITYRPLAKLTLSKPLLQHVFTSFNGLRQKAIPRGHYGQNVSDW